jgi:hypothetical protein
MTSSPGSSVEVQLLKPLILSDSARKWIGMFKSLLVAVGGDLEIHGPTVLAQFLVGD